MGWVILIIIFLPAFIMGAALIYAKPWESIDDVVRRAARETIQAKVPIIAAQIVSDCLKTMPDFRFVKWMQNEFRRVDATLSDRDAFNRAAQTLRLYLKDEKVPFGHPDFAWDREGAIAVAWAYEIDHWEFTP